jgi:hypothetical protein
MRFHTDANLATIRDGDRGDGLDRIPPTRYRRPRFVFSPSDPETSAALRQKIESKMKTAEVLGGFLTGLFTFAAKDIGAALFDRHRTYAAGHRDVLYFITLFCYDQLLIPTSSLGPGRRRKRAPGPFTLSGRGSDVWVLYEGMLRVWYYAFVPATALAGIGVAVLALAWVGPTHWDQWLTAALVIATVSAVPVPRSQSASGGYVPSGLRSIGVPNLLLCRQASPQTWSPPWWTHSQPTRRNWCPQRPRAAVSRPTVDDPNRSDTNASGRRS